MTPRTALAALATIAGLAIAILIVVLIRQPFAPQIAESAVSTTEFPVVVEPFDGARDVALDVEFGTAADVRAPATGTVTASLCQPGASIASGSSPVSIDGAGVLVLHADAPWWRDVSPGESGPDITALQAELTRLGHDVGADGGRFGDATEAALGAVLTSAGLQGTDAVASGALTRLAWLPEPSVTVRACSAPVGARVVAGEPLMALAAPIVSASVSSEQLVPGADSIIRIGDATVPVGADGVVPEGELDALAGAAAGGEGPSAGVPATVQLVEPIPAAALPPSAIAGIDGVDGCVVAAGEPTPVSILLSQLGSTFVQFDGEPPASVLIDAPPDLQCR